MPRTASPCWGGLIGLIFLTVCSSTGYGHHSPAVDFITDEIIEIEGVVESVRWANPHVTYNIDVTDDSGETVTWSVESGAVMELRLRGLDRGVIAPGDRIRVAGLPSRRGRPEIFGTNLLLEDGREVLFDVFSTPRLSDQLLTSEIDPTAAEQAREEAEGIFRVWGTVLNDPNSFPWVGSEAELRLTEVARQARESWDLAADPRVASCEKAMPSIMGAPTFMDFSRVGDSILLRIEEFDTRRVIHMTDTIPPESEPYSLLGYSVGSWDENRLIVETTKVEASIFDDGIPLSREIHILESFAPSAAADRLDYSITITDPQAFTSPPMLTRYFAWMPGVEIAPYNCQVYND